MTLATLTKPEGLSDQWLTELMDRTGHNPGEIAVSHEPVLLAESVQHLMLKEAGVYVDGTTGQGGHSEAMVLAEPQVKAVLGIDWDPRSLEFAQSRLADFADRFLPAAGSYTQMVELAAGQGISSVDGVLLDLGFSSLQIEGPEYGLSFQEDGPLDMRYNPEGGLTAEEIISSYSEHELGQIIRRYGEEPRGMAIARAIIKERPVQGTAQLASIVGSVLGRRPGQRVSPATKTFQALRIAVNDELSNVERGIDAAITLLAPGGRLAVISYHSLEDRIIKTQFNRGAAACVCPPGLPVCTCGQTPRLKIINRRVIKPSQAEIDSNPRSRSAKLRVAERV